MCRFAAYAPYLRNGQVGGGDSGWQNVRAGASERMARHVSEPRRLLAHKAQYGNASRVKRFPRAEALTGSTRLPFATAEARIMCTHG
jgi:hypothetical protein